MPRKKVAVAMSGGVDSSLAAALLQDAGYEVFGIHLKLWADPGYQDNMANLEQVCRSLNIPLHELNLEGEFHSLVISYFCREYSRGRTPNPCLVCNKDIKFGRLLHRALEMGADYLASGHYARVEGSSEGYRLLKASEAAKDQSYFLYTLEQTELPYLIFPLGSRKKTEVKKLAEERGLSTASQRESHDICFIPDSDYRAFLAGYLPVEPGDITDTSGKTLGKHSGLAHYTVGQRQGLGLSSAERQYVLRLDTSGNRLVVGSESQLLSRRLIARKLSWVAGRPPPNLNQITARIRYRSPETPVTLSLNAETAEVEFHEPQRAVAPGQAIVFYQGDAVLGGGIIEESLE
ncbi:MAG TPA: tRNA 2-thiouridine(34) synthase MnmA [Dehalococcoidia bacterium]|nr:tRNA 2-thiouridine(34) synthase MnmA [Dehalococcoidia bacterium]